MVNSNTIDQIVVGYAIKEKPLELSGHVISSIYPSFEGADLIVLCIKAVSAKHCKSSLMYIIYFKKCGTQEVESI